MSAPVFIALFSRTALFRLRRPDAARKPGTPILPLAHGSARTEVRFAPLSGQSAHPAWRSLLLLRMGLFEIQPTVLARRGEYGAGLEPMRWNSVEKTAQWAVLCQLAYNHAIMDLRAYKETLNSLKTPMQGVFVVVLCTVAFVVWLGVLVVITKLLMG